MPHFGSFARAASKSFGAPLSFPLVSFVNSATSTGATITIPSTVKDGDIAVLADRATNSSGTPSTVTPTDWTAIPNTTALTSATLYKRVLSYRLMTASLASTSVTGMDGSSADTKIMLVFRKTGGVWVLPNATEQATTGNPTAQTIALGSCNRVCLGNMGSSGTVSPRTTSISWGAEVNNGTNHYFNYYLQNSPPWANNTGIDMDDEGTANMLTSFTLEARYHL